MRLGNRDIEAGKYRLDRRVLSGVFCPQAGVCGRGRLRCLRVLSSSAATRLDNRALLPRHEPPVMPVASRAIHSGVKVPRRVFLRIIVADRVFKSPERLGFVHEACVHRVITD